jgi:pyruvate kinase
MPATVTKKTRIVATLGPASSRAPLIEGLALAGANVFRINMSHADHAQLAALTRDIRSTGERLGLPLGIMADLRGPRIRIGTVAEGTIQVSDGQTLVLTPADVVGTPARISISYPQLADDVSIGSELLIDDGNIQVIVTALGPDGEVQGRVVRGGTLSSHRGINVPKRRVSLPALTDKDLSDVDAGIANGVDFFALSFVQSADDVRRLTTHIAARGGHQQVIAKIEREPAVTDIEAIARESFAVMIARGDLALEMSIEDTPIVQKHVMTVCRSPTRPSSPPAASSPRAA